MANTTNYRRYGERPVSNVLRREIRLARLKVTLDQELGRPTSDEVKKLAALDLPRLVREPSQDESSTDRRQYDGRPLSNVLREKIRKAQLRVTLDEQLGRQTPEAAKRLAACDLPPLVREPRQHERATDRPGYSQSELSNALRLKILKAQLRVTLDEQLGRTTPERAKKLAALDLPPLVREPRQDESAADRRTCDSPNEEPAPGTSRREVLVARLKVSFNELLGRDIPPEAMRRSRMKLTPIMRRKDATDDATVNA